MHAETMGESKRSNHSFKSRRLNDIVNVRRSHKICCECLLNTITASLCMQMILTLWQVLETDLNSGRVAFQILVMDCLPHVSSAKASRSLGTMVTFCLFCKCSAKKIQKLWESGHIGDQYLSMTLSSEVLDEILVHSKVVEELVWLTMTSADRIAHSRTPQSAYQCSVETTFSGGKFV